MPSAATVNGCVEPSALRSRICCPSTIGTNAGSADVDTWPIRRLDAAPVARSITMMPPVPLSDESVT
ncbi:hypothetical protein G6F46_014154 [Rhizopus delemar]|nr:hypothetical protein G6F46_014154 [Rhizopus delemar]